MVTPVSPPQETHPVTGAFPVFGHHGPDIAGHRDLTFRTERPGPVRTPPGVGRGPETPAEAGR